MNKQKLKTAVMDSFVGEVQAFKPGNVSVYSDGHDMTVKDFMLSAEVSVPLLCQTGERVGKRILDSVVQTKAAVGCNTNLGMLLLFTPIIVAAESGFENETELRKQIKTVLSSLTEKDTVDVYEAIRLANPGGLGEVKSHDVRQAPDCSLLEAMDIASTRDLVAMQYKNNFEQIFEDGLSNIKYFVKRWNSVEWATVSCYLIFLSSLRDSHIERKYDRQVAEKLIIKIKDIANKFNNSSEPQHSIGLLEKIDEELKENKINPGTSADLTAASLLVYNLGQNL